MAGAVASAGEETCISFPLFAARRHIQSSCTTTRTLCKQVRSKSDAELLYEARYGKRGDNGKLTAEQAAALRRRVVGTKVRPPRPPLVPPSAPLLHPPPAEAHRGPVSWRQCSHVFPWLPRAPCALLPTHLTLASPPPRLNHRRPLAPPHLSREPLNPEPP